MNDGHDRHLIITVCRTSLMRLKEAIQIGIKIEDKQLMDADQTRNDVQGHHFHLEALVHAFHVLEQLFRKAYKTTPCYDNDGIDILTTIYFEDPAPGGWPKS